MLARRKRGGTASSRGLSRISSFTGLIYRGGIMPLLALLPHLPGRMVKRTMLVSKTPLYPSYNYKRPRAFYVPPR